MTAAIKEYRLSDQELAVRKRLTAEADVKMGIDGDDKPLHLNIPFSAIGISPALLELLDESNIKTLDDLRLHRPTDIAPPRRHKFGRTSEAELNRIIESCGGWLFGDRDNADTIYEQTQKGNDFLQKYPEIQQQLKRDREVVKMQANMANSTASNSSAIVTPKHTLG